MELAELKTRCHEAAEIQGRAYCAYSSACERVSGLNRMIDAKEAGKEIDVYDERKEHEYTTSYRP